MAQSVLETLCTDTHKIRSTIYSDVFRATINLDGTEREVDIERVALPIPDKKLRTWVPDWDEKNGDEKAAFQRNMTYSLRKGIEIINRIDAKDYAIAAADTTSNANAGIQGVSPHLHQELAADDYGVKVYMVYEKYAPWDRIDATKQADGSYKIDIYQLAVIFKRLQTTIYQLGQRGFYLGVLDMNCVRHGVRVDNGTKRSTFTISNFLFARAADDTGPLYYPQYLPYNAHPSLSEGKRPDMETDIYSWAGAFLSIINGSYATRTPNLDDAVIEGVPEDLTTLLNRVIAQEAPYKEVFTRMNEIVKALKAAKGKGETLVLLPISPSIAPR